jgi:hypothetical protein
MSLASTPETLGCAECGEAFDDGYLPAVETEDGYAPRAGEAVCTACGFNEVGYAGCAPEVANLVDVDGAVLLHVDASGDGVAVLSVKE